VGGEAQGGAAGRLEPDEARRRRRARVAREHTAVTLERGTVRM
jgi:hypothetical protein